MTQISTSIKGKSDPSTTGGAGASATTTGKAGAGGLDSLWEDNWDDDDIEDDFSVQLRCVSALQQMAASRARLMRSRCTPACRKAISQHNGPAPMAT